MTKRNENLSLIRKGRTLIVGIDIAKDTHWARMLDSETSIEVGTAFKFNNNIEGFTRLLENANRAKEEIGAKRVVMAMEPSGHYWKALAGHLSAAKNLRSSTVLRDCKVHYWGQWGGVIRSVCLVQQLCFRSFALLRMTKTA